MLSITPLSKDRRNCLINLKAYFNTKTYSSLIDDLDKIIVLLQKYKIFIITHL